MTKLFDLSASRPLARGLLLAASLGALGGCAPLVLGTAFGGAMVASDRRTSGTQLEDQTIELKAAARLRETLSDAGHISTTSYNRVVLLTGEVGSEDLRLKAEDQVRQVENVKSVVNELAVMGNSSLTSRSNDLLLAGKVKATLIDARDLFANSFKVVVERGNVYLMGMVTEREADRAAALVGSISGVHKVIKVLQIVTEDELARRMPNQAQGVQDKQSTSVNGDLR